MASYSANMWYYKAIRIFGNFEVKYSHYIAIRGHIGNSCYLRVWSCPDFTLGKGEIPTDQFEKVNSSDFKQHLAVPYILKEWYEA